MQYLKNCHLIQENILLENHRFSSIEELQLIHDLDYIEQIKKGV